MKYIQMIDGALNCTFSLFQATDEEFALLFPEPQQDIQYAEDLSSLAHQQEIDAALERVWQRPIRKQDAHGIHGTLFYELERYKKWYREKREDAVNPLAIDQAKRNLFKPQNPRREQISSGWMLTTAEPHDLLACSFVQIVW